MGKRWSWVGLAAGLVALVFTPLWADPPPEVGDRPVTVKQGKDLPDYFVVKAFFWSAHLAYLRHHNGIWASFLRKLNVEEGSEAAHALMLASLEAEAITSETLDLTPWENDPAAFKKVQRDHTRSQVKRLGKVWRHFLLDWKKAGQPEESLFEFLEKRSRHQTQVYTIGEESPEARQEWAEIMSSFWEPDGQS